MSAQADLTTALAELQQLQENLDQTQQTVDKLSASTNVDELARICVGGGVIDYASGPLHRLQGLRLQLEVLARAVEIKQSVVDRCEKQLAEETLDGLRNQRDEIVADFYLACGRIAQICEKLISLDAQARRVDSQCREFDWASFADTFAVNASHPSAGSTDRLAHAIFTSEHAADVKSDTVPFRIAREEAA